MSVARLVAVLALLAMQWLATPGACAQEPIRIGTKVFTESYVLGEISAQLLEAEGFAVERQLGLGGTLFAYEALRGGDIDIYPEYTGTLKLVILDQPDLDHAGLERVLDGLELQLLASLGFNNSYAVAVSQAMAKALGLATVSDLAVHPQLRAGFSHEFLNRSDGWPALSATYGLSQSAVGLEHALAYEAIENERVDITDAYTTDGELSVRRIALLEDDRQFFPTYDAVLLARSDLPAAARDLLAQLDGALDEDTMRQLNYRVASDGETPAAAAAQFLRDSGLVPDARAKEQSRVSRILANTAVHLKLTGIALVLACLVAIPVSLVMSRYEQSARTLVYITGLIQTIPALALLALLIPLVGLGQVPAVIALFLYSLLPIVRNTLTGLFNVDPLLKQVATGMGLTDRQRLLRIELPLAMPTLLAGIKTAAIISIGTATLAAFVGAGGLGEPIVTGLNLNDHRLILEGALPAAALAVMAELLFEAVERFFIPPHLRQ